MASQRPVSLGRRGVVHGRFLPTCPPSTAGDAASRWADDRPVYLPGALAPKLTPAVRASAAAAAALFAAARRGGGLREFVAARLKGSRTFALRASTVEMFDPREVEKVYADERRGGRVVARDLYAKLSWISTDEADVSMRIRFSFGSELLFEWHRDARRAAAADRYAEAVFPECRAVAGNAAVVKALRACAGATRLSERIVYANAPDGGAVFHHDAEPTQLGVLYGQLRGETAWLALPKRELAELLASFGVRGALGGRLATPRKALRALDDHDDAALGRLLNETPAFTRALVARGALVRLRAGDALLLPSHGIDDCCWHAVFAPGRAASLAHSYGIFAAR